MRKNWFRDLPYQSDEEPFQAVDINTREELQELADDEQIPINWPLWDSLVRKTKDDINHLILKEGEYGNGKKRKKVLVFSIDERRVIEVFDSPSECAAHYNIMREAIDKYAREMRVYKKLGVQFILV